MSGRYSIYLEDDLDDKLKKYMKEHKIKTKSVAIKECINKVLLTSEYNSYMFEISEKLNRILYRQNVNKNVLEQMFVNFGFPENYEIEKDELLKEIYQKRNKYIGRFD